MKSAFASIVRGHDLRLLAASVATGILVAIIVAIFEALTVNVVLQWVREQDLAFQVLAPVFGVALAVFVLRYLGQDVSAATSDEYVRAFHDRSPRIPIRQLPAKLLAGVTTIGLGGALGLEGPSIYAGSAMGLSIHSRLGSWLRRDEARLLLTAG
ncbi:MAG: hypothetical protein HOJ56_07795, partial [Acidimicrobiaceae bacterium]|nr:hypothetical protein [Acidimicrobiaceae bacterium]